MNKYLEAINKGRGITIIAQNELADSATFWKSGTQYRSFSLNFGIMDRSDMTDERFIKHMEKMENENALIFIRGYLD